MANLQRFYLKKDEHTYWTLPVESSTTAQDVCDSITSKLELKSGSCILLEARSDKKSGTWEREIAGTEKILAIQSKWNSKKYAEKFVVVKPKVVKRENRNSTHRPNVNNDAKLDGRSEKAHHRPDDEEVELLKREVHLLAESNTDLQQKLFEEKQKRTAMQNSSEVVKKLMEAEQQIDDLRLVVSDMRKGSGQLEFENTQLFNELKEAAHTIGGPYEQKVNAMQRPNRPANDSRPSHSSSPQSSSSTPGHPRVYFEGTRSDSSPDYLRKQQDYHNMKSDDFDRHLEVTSMGLDFAELQKSQRARERALEESKQKLREELDLSKQRRSDVLRESNHILLEELEAIKNKSDLSKKKFVDSLHASKKKLEQELDVIEKKRRAQEEVRWSRPMDGYSSTLSPSKQDGFSISPAISPSPSRREPFGSPSKFDSPSSKYDSPSKYDSSPILEGLSISDTAPSKMFSSPSDRPSTPNFSTKTDRSTPASPSLTFSHTARHPPHSSDRPSTPTERFSSSPKTDNDRLSPQPLRFSSLVPASPSSRRELFSK